MALILRNGGSQSPDRWLKEPWNNQQIRNKDDMGAKTEEGQLAAKVLDDYMKGFQQRNPTLRVFSAHLHIDFIPFITESKRGMDIRVSLKQALARLGFKGGTRSKTEWNQWVASEKEHLAAVMERYGIEWEQKGTHEKHLSVLDFQKQERAKEVADLEERKAELLEENSVFETINGALCDQLTQVNEELHSSEKELSQLR